MDLKHFHAANLLTISRLVLTPVFLGCFLLEWYFAAFVIFIIAASTDLIDGSVARWTKKHSQLGAFLDPLADKLLMITVFSCLVSVRGIPAWFLALVILRDFMIMGGVGILKAMKIRVIYEPFWTSKLTTLSQIMLGFMSLASLWTPGFSIWVYPIIDFAEGSMYLTTILIVISGLQYLHKGIEILQEHYN